MKFILLQGVIHIQQLSTLSVFPVANSIYAIHKIAQHFVNLCHSDSF